MREVLEQKYEKLFDTYHFQRPLDAKKINSVIVSSLREFVKNNNKIAIYCNGGHTRMLMADFMFELKKVKHIVDNYSAVPGNDSGFHLIKDEEIEREGIDAVIISSFKHKDNIIEGLRKNHPTVHYLNIYDKFAENGIDIQSDYYYHNHPYQHYHSINTLQRKIEALVETEELEKAYFELITHYIHIKDFRSAIAVTKKIYSLTGNEIYSALVSDLEDIYAEEINAAASIAERNVLLFCLDGLRRRDMTENYMTKLINILKKTGVVFENAYSFSTSTFESLVPTYSENGDLRTGYYNKNSVEEADCRFIQEAKRQKRQIHFYTDMEHYIEGKDIQYIGVFQTVTEKIWNFILDAVDEDNGLYYIHELYESHFSFSNPYTKEKLISEGTALLFDYLPQKGGKLRTDYEQQHLDAIRYLDDVVSPLIEPMKCHMLIYADHGNLILKNECSLEDVRETQLACGEEWVQIAYAVRSPEMEPGTSKKLISLMSLNEIVISMLLEKKYIVSENMYIKCARSEIYNPDFHYLYKKLGKEKCLQAFEAFIFTTGYKLLIYSGGEMELFTLPSEEKIVDDELCHTLLEQVKDQITVCAADK